MGRELDGDQAGFFVTPSLAMLGGFAIATLLLNTPASIVLFVVYRFVLPGVFAALAALSGGFEKVAPWLDFQAAQDDIYEWDLSGGRGVGTPDRVRRSSGWLCRSASGCGGSCAPRSSSGPQASPDRGRHDTCRLGGGG